MRRLLISVALLSSAVACGKSRLAEDGSAGGGWDEPTAANGFHAEADVACGQACVPKSDREPPKHAVRRNPEPRVVANLDAQNGVGLVHLDGYIVGSSTVDWSSGFSWAFESELGTMNRIVSHGPPSAIASGSAHRMYIATRDSNGRSTIRHGNEVVSASETEVRALVARGEEACWIDANERVRCAHDPGSVRTVAHAPGIDARFLAMDDSAFYVLRGGWITRLAFGASALEAITRADSPVRDLVLADGWLYWTEQGEPRVECQADGSMPICTARGRILRHPYGSVRGVRIESHHATLLARDLESPGGILVVKEQLYVSTAEGLVRVPVKGEGPSATVLTGDPAIGRPALDPVSWTVYVQTKGKLLAVEP